MSLKVNLAIMVGLAACTLVAFHNSFTGAFLLDDQSDLIGNPAIRTLWPVSGILGWPPPVQRPVTLLTLAANYSAGGLAVWGYHAVNLGLHLLAGLILFGLVRRTLLIPPRHPALNPSGTAGAVALLWLIHPLQTESVTYVIQRAESLAGLFHLLVLYSALRAHESSRRNWWAVLAMVSCLIGIGAKESMAVAPLAVLFYDRGFLYPSFRSAFHRRWGLYAGLALAWPVLAALLWAGPHNYAGLVNARYGFFEYIRTQPGVILHYLRLCFWPGPLVLDYGWPVARTAGEILPGGIIIGALLVFLVRSFSTHPRISAIGLWGFLALAPSSSVLPLRDMAFEHRMYLPLAAVVSLAVAGVSLALSRFSAARSLRWLRTVLLVAVAVPLMALTVQRNAVYGSAVGMFEDLVAKRPLSVRGQHNLAAALAEQGRMEEALVHISRTVEIQPDYAEGWYNRGYILSRLGRRNEAMRAYRRSLEIKPHYQYAAINLAILLRQQGRNRDAEEVILRMQEAVQDLH